MVDIIAYIREVPVGDEEHRERKRFMFMRDPIGDRFLCKSRYKYIVPKVELDYNELVNAIYNAIDKEIENSGGEASMDENPYTTLSYDELMEEAKVLYNQAIAADMMPKVAEILNRDFGKPIKFSEIEPSQVELLNKSLIDIRNLF